MLKLDQISALHIELTTNCNARCPMCMRNYRGYDFNSGYPITELTLTQIQKILSTKFLKQIKLIILNGNLGDFGLCKDAIEIVDYFLKNSFAKIQIETNGSTRSPDWWAQLAHKRVEILWALDGLADTHALYRQDTIWQKIIDNACAYIANGGNAAWKFILFEHNRHQLKDCENLSKKLGFKNFLVYDQGRNQGPVFTRQGQLSHWLGIKQDQKIDIDRMIQHHLTWFDPKKPFKNIKDESVKINCNHIKTKELYIAADGTVYPCCWLGYYPGKMNHFGNSQIAPLVIKNNALEYDLEECIDWFENVEKSWEQKTIAQGRLYTCISCCGTKDS